MNIAPSTDEDLEIRLDRKCNRCAAAWINTLRQEDRDAHIMRQLARTRRNNKRARAFAEQPGEIAS